MTKITEEGVTAMSTALAKPRVGTTARIRYTNWRGHTAVRTVDILGYWYGSTEWHPEQQEMFSGYEHGTGKSRDFAVAGVLDWNVPR